MMRSLKSFSHEQAEVGRLPRIRRITTGFTYGPMSVRTCSSTRIYLVPMVPVFLRLIETLSLLKTVRRFEVTPP
ncbi:uncharacterized protein EKO05_0005279 [Ascochyta rabiei]|uniref:uncharacterized protein n=1 Tax=Didymella rabiei TaxID=5454 RepID=UPI0021FD6C61|nr:uncharacterized protein EKO05_0005279 [Ascochyta rabiei]UPX14807.1 hypothetical protein EKO05_0005279 [Ascochyta rabiei]